MAKHNLDNDKSEDYELLQMVSKHKGTNLEQVEELVLFRNIFGHSQLLEISFIIIYQYLMLIYIYSVFDI